MGVISRGESSWIQQNANKHAVKQGKGEIMEYQYIVQSGNVKEHNNKLVFEGKKIEYPDPNTKAIVSSPEYSAILFPIALKSG